MLIVVRVQLVHSVLWQGKIRQILNLDRAKHFKYYPSPNIDHGRVTMFNLDCAASIWPRQHAHILTTEYSTLSMLEGFTSPIGTKVNSNRTSAMIWILEQDNNANNRWSETTNIFVLAIKMSICYNILLVLYRSQPQIIARISVRIDHWTATTVNASDDLYDIFQVKYWSKPETTISANKNRHFTLSAGTYVHDSSNHRTKIENFLYNLYASKNIIFDHGPYSENSGKEKSDVKNEQKQHFNSSLSNLTYERKWYSIHMSLVNLDNSSMNCHHSTFFLQ